MRCRTTLFSLACFTIVCVAGVTTGSSQDNEPSYWKEEGLQNNLKEMLDRLDREERGESGDLHEQSERLTVERQQGEQTMQDQERTGETAGEASETFAYSCEEDMPSTCWNAIEKGRAIIEQFNHSTGATGAASEAYCLFLLGIEVNSFCADQYRAIGREDCAEVSDLQSEEYRRALPQVLDILDAASESQVRELCSWER